MPPQPPNVAALFDRLADSYDRTGVDLFGPIADRLVAELAPQPGERALDIGCGRGAVLLPLSRAVGPEGRVVGIDVSAKMVEAAAREASTAGLPADVRVGDAAAPDFPPESFDVIASSLVLFFLPHPGPALEAWREILRPGGRAGVATFGPMSEPWKAVDAVFHPYLPPGMLDPRTQPTRGPFGSDDGMESLLRDAGYTGVRTATEVVRVRFDDADHWERWTWSVGQRAMWEAIPESDRSAVKAEAAERLEDTRDAHGRIGFDQVARFTLGTRP